MLRHFTTDTTHTAYTDEGEGETVVLLHGGFSDSRDFHGNLAGLADRYRVLALDRRGLGRTPDVPGPISLTALVDDVVALIEGVTAPPVNLIGYSQGATVVLAVAASHPALVRRLVSISGAADPDAFLVRPTAGGTMPQPIVDAHAEVSPDGRDHFPVIQRKYVAALPDFRVTAPLTAIAMPTLVMAGDDDIVSLDHQLHLYRALPAAELAILPAASHLLLQEHPELVTQLVTDFVTRPPSATLLPIRRAGTSA